jgi:hypothetical protein
LQETQCRKFSCHKRREIYFSKVTIPLRYDAASLVNLYPTFREKAKVSFSRVEMSETNCLLSDCRFIKDNYYQLFCLDFISFEISSYIFLLSDQEKVCSDCEKGALYVKVGRSGSSLGCAVNL